MNNFINVNQTNKNEKKIKMENILIKLISKR